MTIIRYSHIKELIEGNDGFEPSTNRLTVYCSTAELIPQNKKPPNFWLEGLYNSNVIYIILHQYPLTTHDCLPKLNSVDYKSYVLELFSLLIYI